MSFNPLLTPAVPYIGVPYAQPTKLCSPLTEDPKLVALRMIWSAYGVSFEQPDAAAFVDIMTLGPTAPIKAIRGCYIDNTGSDGSVFVYFPDTRQTVTCAPYSTNWQPVITNGLQCTIIGKGFATNDTSETQVYLLNTPVNPGFSNEIQFTYPQVACSPQLFKGLNIYTSGFIAPAIGDQFQYNQQVLNNLAVTQSVPLFGTPLTQGGTITLTDISLDYYNRNTGGNGAVQSKISSPGLGGIFHQAQFLDTVASMGSSRNLFMKTGLQLKLNAAEAWTWQVGPAPAGVIGATGAVLSLNLGFSYQGVGSLSTGNISTLDNTTFALVTLSSDPGFPGVYGGVKFTAPIAMNVTGFTLQHRPGPADNPADIAVQVAIYTDVAGSPGALVALSQTVIVPNNTGQYTFPFFPFPAFVLGTTYWFVFYPANGISNRSFDTYQAVDAYSSGINSVIANLAAAQLPSLNQKWKFAVSYQT